MNNSISNNFADISIPSPSAIIEKSDAIFIGNFEAGISKLTFRVNEALKGPDWAGKSIYLSEPSEGLDFTFDLNSLVRTIGKEPTILLGDFRKNENSLFLKWFRDSIWPPGQQFSNCPSQSFSQCKSFIDATLAYDRKSDNLGDLITILLNDIASPNIYAALDFMDVSLKNHVREHDKYLEMYVVWSAFARVVSEKRIDAFINQKLLSLFPMLPASLSIPYFLELARSADSSLSSASKSHVEALLKANELLPCEGTEDVNKLSNIYNMNKHGFWINDTEIALRMFDSDFYIIRESYAELLLEVIVGKPLSELIGETPPKDAKLRKQLWQKEIAKFNEQLHFDSKKY